MKRVLALLIAGVCMSAGVLKADQKADALKLIPAQREAILADFDVRFKPVIDPGKLECYKEYNEAIKKARAALAACLNNPSNGSPLDKFNALTNAQMITFCGNQTPQQCLAGVMAKERAWCEDKVDFREHITLAEKVRQHCLKCDTLHDRLIALEKEFVAAGCARRLVIQQ